jgi:hypothetical protein
MRTVQTKGQIRTQVSGRGFWTRPFLLRGEVLFRVEVAFSFPTILDEAAWIGLWAYVSALVQGRPISVKGLPPPLDIPASTWQRSASVRRDYPMPLPEELGRIQLLQNLGMPYVN